MSVASSRPAPAVHARVLQAACALFLRDGYRVSMESVAREAGVSKQTVYAHFENKDGLFNAAVEQLVHPLRETLRDDAQDLETALYALAGAHQHQVMDKSKIALCRMLLAEAPRFPKAARVFFRLAMENLQEQLSLRMARAMDGGEIRRADPDAAAELFLSMIHGLEGDRRLFGVQGRSKAAQDAWANQAVTIFTRAYAIDVDVPARIHKAS